MPARMPTRHGASPASATPQWPVETRMQVLAVRRLLGDGVPRNAREIAAAFAGARAAEVRFAINALLDVGWLHRQPDGRVVWR
ncbi:MAG TPA: hypothetical protein VHI13_18590 [Candidatus Kapabacteria bacterium]|nr:hypothetical protein [Candidatus Kapabacteria bacterium]